MKQIIEKYNLNPEKIVYIGDDVNDVETFLADVDLTADSLEAMTDDEFSTYLYLLDM